VCGTQRGSLFLFLHVNLCYGWDRCPLMMCHGSVFVDLLFTLWCRRSGNLWTYGLLRLYLSSSCLIFMCCILILVWLVGCRNWRRVPLPFVLLVTFCQLINKDTWFDILLLLLLGLIWRYELRCVILDNKVCCSL